jgi:hypothetical protein
MASRRSGAGVTRSLTRTEGEAVELLPCGHCGAIPSVSDIWILHPENDCILSGYEFGDATKDTNYEPTWAIAAWNSRATPSLPTAIGGSTEAGHTPGPWRYGHANNYDGFYIAPDVSLPTLAAVQTDGRANVFNFPGQTEANARLIAAAPELLGALEKAELVLEVADRFADALSVLAHTHGLSRDVRNALADYDGPRFEVRRQTRAAISKARGQ